MKRNLIRARSRGVILLTFAMAGIANSASKDTVTVGDPKNPATLAAAINQAHDDGAEDITINPGLYELPPDKTGTITLNHWQNVSVHASGVTLIFENLAPSPLTMEGCKNVTWDGGIIEFVHPSATQGRITAIASEPGGFNCDFQIDSGYPTNIDPQKSTYDVVDASTRVLKAGTGDWSPISAEALGPPGSFRLHYRDKPGFAVNDWLITRAPGGYMTAHLAHCENCTLKNITFCNGGFATIFDEGGPGGNHYLKCKIEPGPRPPGATEDQIVSNGADGLHSVGTATGPDIEDCDFTGVFHDDCIAIHGGFGRVIQAKGNTIILKKGGGDPVVGDPLRIADTHGFFGQAYVTAIEKLENGDAKVSLDHDLHIPIDHSQDSDDGRGTKANNPNRCGRGYNILRCRLGNTRSRGILVKADDGLIDHCQIEGCAMSGISVGPEFWWNEANYAWNVTISNNTFLNCSKGSDQASIWVHGDGAQGNRKIKISDNTFDECYGPHLIKLEWTDGAEIIGNKIDGFHQTDPKAQNDLIWINQSKDVQILDNVGYLASFVGQSVVLAPGMISADVKKTGSTGINLIPAR